MYATLEEAIAAGCIIIEKEAAERKDAVKAQAKEESIQAELAEAERHERLLRASEAYETASFEYGKDAQDLLNKLIPEPEE